MKSFWLLVGVFIILFVVAGWNDYQKAHAVTRSEINCNKMRPHIGVLSSVDGNHYNVDICAVADSAEGMDFRTEIK